MDILGAFGMVTPKYEPTGARTIHGYPVVNPHVNPNMRDDEYRNMKLQFDVSVKVFDLLDPKQLDEYAVIRDRIINRASIQLDRRVAQSPDGTVLKVLLEWADPKGRAKPPGA